MSEDVRANLRRLVEQESARQRAAAEVERIERERRDAEQARQDAERDVLIRREHERARDLISIFLDAMRRAGNPGIRPGHVKEQPKQESTSYTPNPRWAVGEDVEGWLIQGDETRRDPNQPRLFLTTTGHLYEVRVREHWPEGGVQNFYVEKEDGRLILVPQVFDGPGEERKEERILPPHLAVPTADDLQAALVECIARHGATP